MIYVLYNVKANNGRGFEGAKKIEDTFDASCIEYKDVEGVLDYAEFLKDVKEDDQVVLAGGDGTLNYFVNHTSEAFIRTHEIDYWPAGTGNDFANEFGVKHGELMRNISKYLVDLPTVTVNQTTHKFINGVGYGIDGYCCEVGDELRKTTTKPINYAGIAIKGILFKFKPLKATVTVDGDTKTYAHTWLAPVMNGKFYGGGMMPTPNQKRDGTPKKLSVMVYRTAGKLTALSTFPGMFKGEHIKKEKVVSVFEGQTISVSFDRPCACQIDGETILNVSKIECHV